MIRVAVAVAVLALVARVAAQLALGFYVDPETWEHEEIARNMLAGRGYVYDHNGAPWYGFATPLFAWIIAAVYAVFGVSAQVLGVLNALLGAALAVIVALIGERVGGRTTARLAGAGVAVHPGLLAYGAKVHPLSLDALLAASLVLGVLLLRDRASSRAAIALGALAGMAALSRPTLLPFAVAGVIWAAVSGQWDVPRAVRRGAIAGAVALVIVAPWVGRNAMTIPYVGLSTSFGEVLWIGNNPMATGSALSSDLRPMIDAAPAVRERVWGQPELAQDAIFRAEAQAFIVSQPADAVSLDARKLVSFWSFGPTTGAQYPTAWYAAYATLYVGIVVAASAGVASVLRTGARATLVPIALLFGTVSGVQSLFFVEGRHRWEIEALLIVLAAAGVTAALSRIGRA